jgi:erythromycin esterase-like protein
VLRSNDNWRSDQRAAIQATTIPPKNELEAALVETLQPGHYTAIVRGGGDSTGVALVEVYALENNYGAWPLAGDDPNLGTTPDLEPLRALIGDATVAAFGESYHTSGGFYRMKHRIFRFLVEQMGFRAFAIESGWQGAELAAAYVQGGGGTAEQAISQHINVWQGTEYADLVRWIREWNSAHSNPSDKVTLFGFDIQQPTDDGPGLVAYLERIGIPQNDPRSTGISQCEGVNQSHPFGQIPPERHNACLQTLASIEQHFTNNKADLVNQTSAQDFDIAMLRVVGLRAWENQVFIIAHDRPVGYSARDEGMAYAFNVMRGMKAPNAKTMVWAANSHVARRPLVTGEVPMGSHLANTFGNNYATFGLNAFITEVDYASCGPVPRQPDGLEDALAPVLAAQNAPAVLVDTRGSSILEPRVYASGIDQLRPHLEYDGIIYLQHSPKFHPLLWPPCN